MPDAKRMEVAAISRTWRAGASALLLAACGTPRPADTGTPAAPKPLSSRPLAEVFVLEAAGVLPDDTSLALAPGTARVIVLRRSAPDFGLFARIEVGDSTLHTPNRGSTAGLTLRPRPGEYALDLELSGGGALDKGGTLLFSYGEHFVAPAGARERYGSDIYFERELSIGRLTDKGEVLFLPTERPGSDMLRAPLSGPGRYLVVAPR